MRQWESADSLSKLTVLVAKRYRNNSECFIYERKFISADTLQFQHERQGAIVFEVDPVRWTVDRVN